MRNTGTDDRHPGGTVVLSQRRHIGSEAGQGDLSRYSRQIILPEIGIQGQRKLSESSVLLIGAGGLGSPAALYLAAAGVGRIGLVDGDRVDRSNLHRQVLFSDASVGESKVEVAAERLLDLNPEIEVVTFDTRITRENAARILRSGPWDVIVDGADNFPTRYLCNDIAVLHDIPLVHGSIYRFEGQATVLNLGGGPCYRCLYPEPPETGTVPSCGEIGVLGLLPGIIGTIMATETVKLILSIGESLSGRLMMYDALSMKFRELHFDKFPECRLCGDAPTISSVESFDYGTFCGEISDMNRNQKKPEKSMKSITVNELAALREAGTEHVLIDVREPNEYEFANIEGTLIPLGEIADRKDEVPTDKRVVIMCRSGGRSGQAVAMLEAAGWTNVENLSGGILAWADNVDRSIPKY